MEPGNMVDQCVVCVKKNKVVVRNLPLRDTGRFAKLVFSFIEADNYASWNVVITKREVNLSAGKGMQAVCFLKISGTKHVGYFKKGTFY